eukprot:3142367-Pyramimonas_sp.AAC.1
MRGSWHPKRSKNFRILRHQQRVLIQDVVPAGARPIRAGIVYLSCSMPFPRAVWSESVRHGAYTRSFFGARVA